MSSTYSTDLRLELIGTGDQAGVWGSTTNNTLGTLMEAAIAGYTSVSITASPQALTALDGATDQARYNSIALTTVTGANFVVCTPPTPKLYTFYNTTAYTATITNATAKNGTTPTGGTTVVIPAGKTMSVWTDGSNFTQKSDHLISPTMSSPTMTGTPIAPTAATGTNTTQVATTAFVAATLLASVYPVGSIYTNASVATNPGTLLGFGTWTAFGAGRVAVGFDSGNALFDTAEETGGSADAIVVSHTHTGTTGNQSADHSHTFSGDTSTATLVGDMQQQGNRAGIQYVSGVFSRSGSTSYAANSSGGDLPGNIHLDVSHNHSYSGTTSGVSANHTHDITTNSTGSSGTNANYQPYITVYMWKRTA